MSDEESCSHQNEADIIRFLLDALNESLHVVGTDAEKPVRCYDLKGKTYFFTLDAEISCHLSIHELLEKIQKVGTIKSIELMSFKKLEGVHLYLTISSHGTTYHVVLNIPKK